jgi:hypothetical protein
MQFNGVSYLGGIAWNGGSWTFSTANNLIVGSIAGSWHSTLFLTLGLVPKGSSPFSIDVFQFSNGVLQAGATTHLSWTGTKWSWTSAPGLTPNSMPEPSVFVLLAISTLTGLVMRKKLIP